MNSIILIDDRTDFADSFIQEAQTRGISTSHKKSFVGLKEVLPKYQHNFAAVVLDIKCLLKEDQQIEDASFITAALSYLDQHIPKFPRFILTGDDIEFEKFKGYFKNEKVFLKTPQDLNNLFIDLKFNVDNSEVLKIKRDYSEVFELFVQGKMNNDAEVQLIRILQKGLNETDYGQFKGILADVRSMQEGVYKSIRDRNPIIVPVNMFQSNGMIKFNMLMRHLCGGEMHPAKPSGIIYQNSTIFQLTNSLYWTCGEYIHEDPNRTYFISRFTLKSLIYSLLELMIWSKQF